MPEIGHLIHLLPELARRSTTAYILICLHEVYDMLSTLAFYRAYQEDITVAGGLRLGIRMLQPADKQLLLDSFRCLSTESRYFRFFAPKRELTSAELCCLTESDGNNRLALGAFELHSTGAEGAVLGVSQFIRLREVVGAEFSLVVIDDWQCLGIGRRLLERLLVMAAAQGIQYFHGHVLTDNQRACRLIRHVCKEVTFHVEGSEITVTGLLRCPGQAVRVTGLAYRARSAKYLCWGVGCAKRKRISGDTATWPLVA